MAVYKDKNNKTYYFKISIGNKQYLRRGFKSKQEAAKQEAIFLLADKSKRSKIKYEPTYCDLLDEYKKYLKEQLKLTTYLSTIKTIDNYYKSLFPDVGISKLTYLDVSKARELIDKSNVQVKTKNRRRNFLLRFFRFVKVYFEIDFYLIERMQPFKDYSISKTILKNDMIEHDDFIKIYKACDSTFYQLAFLTFYLYGLRLGELLALKVNAFDFDNKMFEVYQEVSFKTGIGHYVIVPP